MKQLISWFVKAMAKLHEKILSINNGHEMNFNDKQLHFLVFVAVTLGLFLCVSLLFRILAKKKVTAIAWIYTVTVDVALMFAIEVGQGLTHTGEMDLADVTYGMWGMIAAMGIYAVLWAIKKIFKILGTETAGDRSDNLYTRYLD